MTKDEAEARSKALALRMGPKWEAVIWENLGWHFNIKSGHITIRDSSNYFGNRFSAWIEPGIVIGNTYLQIIEAAETPEKALQIACEKAMTVITEIRSAIETLEKEVSQ